MTKKMVFTAILVTFTLLLQYGCKTTEVAEKPENTDQTSVASEPAQATQGETSADSEKIAIRVNCGFEGEPYTDEDSNIWQPDRLITDELDWGAVDGQIIQRPTLDIQGTNCPDIYKSETYSMSAYKFKVPKGKYTVILHFAETYEGIYGEGQRVFSASINEKTILENFDPYKEAGKFATPVVKKYNGIEPVDGVITVGFTPNIENPQICGIEVVSE